MTNKKFRRALRKETEGQVSDTIDIFIPQARYAERTSKRAKRVYDSLE